MEVDLFLHELLVAQVALDIDSNKQHMKFKDIVYENININHKDIEDRSSEKKFSIKNGFLTINSREL